MPSVPVSAKPNNQQHIKALSILEEKTCSMCVTELRVKFGLGVLCQSEMHLSGVRALLGVFHIS